MARVIVLLMSFSFFVVRNYQFDLQNPDQIKAFGISDSFTSVLVCCLVLLDSTYNLCLCSSSFFKAVDLMTIVKSQGLLDSPMAQIIN